MAYKVIILYQLYMPSYFLGTFTEYPYLRVSFFANNMFSSRPLYKQKRTIGSYERRNIPLFFGLELSAIIN